MNWIETIIKEYEDILNDKSIRLPNQLYTILLSKHLDKGICKYIRNTNNKPENITDRHPTLMVMDYMEFKGITSNYIAEIPFSIYFVQSSNKECLALMKSSMRIRIKHLYKMKDLYYPIRERGITITKGTLNSKFNRGGAF